MSGPLIHGKRRPVPASALLAALGDALGRIRAEDRLTWADVGVELGKSEDQAAKYADGTAEMGVFTYHRARDAWGSRFTDGADKLFGHVTADNDGRAAQTAILKAALALSVALEDDELTVEEVTANRATLEKARDAIDGQLARIALRAAS